MVVHGFSRFVGNYVCTVQQWTPDLSGGGGTCFFFLRIEAKL